MALYGLAKYCGYGTLHDEMIMDKIVVRICNEVITTQCQINSGQSSDSGMPSRDSQVATNSIERRRSKTITLPN